MNTHKNKNNMNTLEHNVCVVYACVFGVSASVCVCVAGMCVCAVVCLVCVCVCVRPCVRPVCVSGVCVCGCLCPLGSVSCSLSVCVFGERGERLHGRSGHHSPTRPSNDILLGPEMINDKTQQSTILKKKIVLTSFGTKK